VEEGILMEGIFDGRGNLSSIEELEWCREISMAKGHFGGAGNLAKWRLKAEEGAILRISLVGGKGELNSSL
jgi:hypothetical protein